MKLGIIAVLACARVAAADPAGEHERAFTRGNELFDQHAWAAARAEYLVAYEVDPRPLALFNIASTYRYEHDPVNERRYYQRYLEAAGPDAEYAAVARARIAEIDAAVRTEVPASTGYPQAAIERPPVLPAGQASFAGGVDVLPTGDVVTASGSIAARYTALTWVGASYGVTDRLQLGGELAVDVAGTQRSAAFALASVGLADGELAAAVRGAAGVAFDGPSLYDLRLAIPLRWRLGDRFALTTDDDQLVVALDRVRRVYVAAPIAVAYQLAPALYATAGTRIVELELTAPRASWLGAGDRYATFGLTAVPLAALDIVARFAVLPDGVGGSVFVRWRI